MSTARRGLRPAAVPARPSRRAARGCRRGARRHRRLLGRHAGRPDARRSRSRALRRGAPRRRPATRRPSAAPAVPRRRRRRGSSAGSASRSTPTTCRVHRHQGTGGVAAADACRCATRRATPCSTRRSRTPPTRWARCSPACARCRCRSTTQWHLDLDRVDPADADRALAALAQRPEQPDRRGRDARGDARRGRLGTRRGHPRRQRRVLRRVHLRRRGAPRPSPRSPAPTACSPCTRCRSARTWPGSAPGSSPATASSSRYLGEMRKHGGLMMPAPIQAAAAAALGDDEHVHEQQARYARRRARSRCPRSSRAVSCTTAVRPPSTSGCATPTGADDGWAIAARLATTGLLVAPGDFYGAASADHVRRGAHPHRRAIELAVRTAHA